MLVIDLLIAGLVVALAVWGFSQGLTPRVVALVGFATGAVIGSRVAPLVLSDGIESSYAPIVALPAALIVGGLLAALFERVGIRLRGRRERRLGVADGLAGGLVAAVLGLAVAWIVGAVVTQVNSLEDEVAESEILDRMNAALPPPGPVLASEPRLPPIPTFEGKLPSVGEPNPAIARDPDVRRAQRSLVRVIATGCGHGATGSGWVAAEGVVATNAHVVAGADAVTVQVRGQGPAFSATPIWYDKKSDFALLRAEGVRTVAALDTVARAKHGTDGATLGFPRGRRETRAARVAPLGSLEGRLGGRALVSERPVVPFVGRVQPGNSGGPIVDAGGRVLTTVFLQARGRNGGFGVPNRYARRGLRRASHPVSPGDCDDPREILGGGGGH